MTDAVQQALDLWGVTGCRTTLVAQRENHVYRVEGPVPMALRLHRAGLRSKAELRSELDWMAALARGGLSVPRPCPARDGALCHQIGDRIVDMLSWLDGAPMGSAGRLDPALDGPTAYGALGAAMARLHLVSDGWTPPAQFTRPAWDADGLLGEAPLWGRFWDNPRLTPDQAALMRQARAAAMRALADHLPQADYGLIHADLVPENVLIGPNGPHLIDFDDGGYGFRLFDIATVLNHALRAADPGPLRQAFLVGYQGLRAIDLAALPLFQALRAFTYVGWIVPRLSEPGATARHARFTTLACQMAETLLIRG